MKEYFIEIEFEGEIKSLSFKDRNDFFLLTIITELESMKIRIVDFGTQYN